VAASNFVKSLEELEPSSDSLATLYLELDWDAFLELDRELGRDIGGCERI
jgi:hypothetical protein